MCLECSFLFGKILMGGNYATFFIRNLIKINRLCIYFIFEYKWYLYPFYYVYLNILCISFLKNQKNEKLAILMASFKKTY